MRPLLQRQRQTKILRNMGGLFIASYLSTRSEERNIEQKKLAKLADTMINPSS